LRIGVSYVRIIKLGVHGPMGSACRWIWTCNAFADSRMQPLTGHVTTYPLISDLFENGNSLVVVTEIIHRHLFGWRYHLFEPTIYDFIDFIIMRSHSWALTAIPFCKSSMESI
jgi:hypothetical protein